LQILSIEVGKKPTVLTEGSTRQEERATRRGNLNGRHYFCGGRFRRQKPNYDGGRKGQTQKGPQTHTREKTKNAKAGHFRKGRSQDNLGGKMAISLLEQREKIGKRRPQGGGRK